MGDDLGDEWWTHEGDSGTFIACHLIDFRFQNLLLPVVNCKLFCELKSVEKSRFVNYMLAVS